MDGVVRAAVGVGCGFLISRKFASALITRLVIAVSASLSLA